jgi:hypothetical protein
MLLLGGVLAALGEELDADRDLLGIGAERCRVTLGGRGGHSSLMAACDFGIS